MGDIFQQTYSKPYDMGQPILNGGYYYSPSGRLCPRHLFSCFTSVSSFRHAIHISQWPGHVHGGHRAAHRPRLGPAAAPSQGGSRPVSHPALSPSLRWKYCFLEFLFLEKIFQDHLVPPPLQCFFLLQALQPQLRQLQWPVWPSSNYNFRQQQQQQPTSTASIMWRQRLR